MINPLTIGLALSGGTARGVAHVGALKALAKSEISIDCITGTSGGAIAATAYAAGMPLDKMEAAANMMGWSDLASFQFSRLGFVSSKPIEAFMIEQFGSDIQFSDLKIPCAVIATNLHTGYKHVFTSGSVARAVRISCSLPHFFLPVEHEGQMLIDGGLSEYLPAQSARELGAEFVIGVNLGSQASEYKKPKHILQLFMQVNNLVATQNLRHSIDYADVLVEPALSGFSAYDFDNSEKLIALLEHLTESQIEDIKATYTIKNTLLNRLRGRLVK